MLDRLEERAREMGYGRIVLDTPARYPGGQALYLKNGYREVRRGTGGPASHTARVELIYFEKDLK